MGSPNYFLLQPTPVRRQADPHRSPRLGDNLDLGHADLVPRPTVIIGDAARAPSPSSGQGASWPRQQCAYTPPTLTEIVERHGVTPYQVALALVAGPVQDHAYDPGTGSVDHVKKNVAAAGLPIAGEVADDLLSPVWLAPQDVDFSWLCELAGRQANWRVDQGSREIEVIALLVLAASHSSRSQAQASWLRDSVTLSKRCGQKLPASRLA